MSVYKKVLATLDLPVLTRLIRDASLKFIDVGGRGEAFSPLLPFASFADYYVAEPDDAEARRLVEQLPRQAPWRSVTVASATRAARVMPPGRRANTHEHERNGSA